MIDGKKVIAKKYHQKGSINVMKESKMLEDRYKTSLVTAIPADVTLAYLSMQHRIPGEYIEGIESQYSLQQQ